jgi:GH24 family phage-related lysozyme (muramidase)
VQWRIRKKEVALNTRIVVASLSLSAIGFISIATSEHYTDTAIIPTKGDRPTYGLGSTYHADGTPVRMGERITPVRAIQLAGEHIAKEEAKCRDSLPGVALTQTEYDLYCGDWVYQYGSSAWANSSMRQDLLVGNFWRACQDLLLYRFAAGFDCSTPGNTRCRGVWTRQLGRYQRCMEVQ